MDQEENEQMFAPLQLAVGRLGLTEEEQLRVMGEYMYMYNEKDIAAYKHVWTRNYVLVGQQGDVQEGEIDTERYS